MTKTETQKQLDENIPKDVIRTRTQGGVTLSYLETWQVIDRLNQVLGQGNWGYTIQTLTKVFEGEIEQASGKAFTTSYTATVALSANVDNRTVYFTDVGYGDGTDRRSQGKAHELGVKEAVSDGLKRSAKNLGRSMGLALYDKTQEFVGETVGKPVVQTEPAINTRQPNLVKQPEPGVSTKTDTIKQRPIKELLSTAFKILEAQKKSTEKELTEKYLKGQPIERYKSEGKTLVTALEGIKKDFPDLRLS